MNVLNIKLHCRDEFINKLFKHICAFEMKLLLLWVGQLKQCNYANFPTLSANQPNQATTYVGCFYWTAARTFKTQFADLHANSQALKLCPTLLPVTVVSLVVHLQMELIDLQGNIDLKTKVTEVAIVKFYQKYVQPTSFP